MDMANVLKSSALTMSSTPTTHCYQRYAKADIQNNMYLISALHSSLCKQSKRTKSTLIPTLTMDCMGFD
jgi:hypothetical protein